MDFGCCTWQMDQVKWIAESTWACVWVCVCVSKFNITFILLCKSNGIHELREDNDPIREINCFDRWLIEIVGSRKPDNMHGMRNWGWTLNWHIFSEAIKLIVVISADIYRVFLVLPGLYSKIFDQLYLFLCEILSAI